MAKYAYPAIFTPEEDGGYSVRFPDFESCYTCGDDIADAIEMARDALALVLYDYECDKKTIPEPSTARNIRIDGESFINYISCDTLAYFLLTFKQRGQLMYKTIKEWKENLIIVRGGGDIATGTIYKLFQCGFPLLVLEIENPSCIRRTISFCEAVFDGEVTVEGVKARRAESVEEAFAIYEKGEIPVMVDPDAGMIAKLKPTVVVDAILAKRNLGTKIDDAPVVVGLGPGFCAGKDVDAVIETKRGHRLGRVIYEGEAIANTGIPGIIAGYGKERVIHSPGTGKLHIIKQIGDEVAAGETIAVITEETGKEIPVITVIAGIVRGMIREGYPVEKGLKIADVDPRVKERDNCHLISDKARCVAGGTLEAILHLRQLTPRK